MAATRSKKVKETYTEADVTKALGISKTELRAFEKEGLFDYMDSKKKKIDFRNFMRIKLASTLKKELGVNLEGIDVILAMREKMIRMQRKFSHFLGKVYDQLDDKDKQRFRKQSD